MLADVNNIQIGYDSYGESEQAALVLLHAFPLNRQQWSGQAEEIARANNIRVVTIDLRGFGESSLEIGPTTMEQMAGDVRGLLDALDIGDVVIGGLSLGGYVAFECLRQFPRRIGGLILADTTAKPDTPEQRAARETTAQFAEAQGEAAGRALIDRNAQRYFAALTLRQRPEIVERAREIAAQNSSVGIASAARGMGLRADSTDLLLGIKVPTLVIVGEQDAITPVEEATFTREHIPGAQLEIITEAGHFSNVEQPKAFVGAIARFAMNQMGAVPPSEV